MMPKLVTRREMAAASGLALLANGCGTDTPDVKNVATPVIQVSKIGLRGYEIVAFKAGEKLITLPHPAVRILAVALIISAVAAELVVEYLDDELQRREVREKLTDEQRMEIERQRSVTFVTANGQEEKVSLGDNRYGEQPK